MDNSILSFPPDNSADKPHTVVEEIPLTDHTRIKSDRLREILTTWQNSIGAHRVPDWKAFNPMQFPELLPTMSLFSNEGTLEKPDFLLRL